jgi:tetratricopeptide (TPR) repeat protein
LLDSQKLYGPMHIETLRIRALLTDVYGSQRNKVALRAELDTLLPLVRAQATVDAEPLVRALKNQSNLAFEEGRLDEVIVPAREAFEIGRRSLGERNALTVEASTLISEGMVMTFNVSTKDMLQQTANSLQLALAAYGQKSDHAQVVRSREVRARSLGVAGYYREAIVEQRAAIAAVTQTLGPTDRIFVDMKNSLGSWERRVGEIKESLLHSSESLAILVNQGETHTADYATVLMSHGNNLFSARRPMAAQAALAQAETTCLELYGPTHWDSLTAHFNRAMALAYGGRSKEALESLDLLKNPSIIIKMPWWIDYVRGTVYRLAQQPQAAIDALVRANSEIPKNPREPWDRVRVLLELGQAQLDVKQLDAADGTLATAEHLFEELKVEMHPAYAEVILARARIDLAHNAPARSLPRLEGVDAYWQKYDPDSRGGGEPARWLAKTYQLLGRETEAAAASVRAKRLLSLQWQ